MLTSSESVSNLSDTESMKKNKREMRLGDRVLVRSSVFEPTMTLYDLTVISFLNEGPHARTFLFSNPKPPFAFSVRFTCTSVSSQMQQTLTT